METHDVGQDSRLGRLGLKAIWERGICGPPYDLSDLDVHVSRLDGLETIDVDFYDMCVCVDTENPLYQDFVDAIRDLEVAA